MYGDVTGSTRIVSFGKRVAARIRFKIRKFLKLNDNNNVNVVAA